MIHTRTNQRVTLDDLMGIVDAPTRAFSSTPNAIKAQALRHAANALDIAAPNDLETVKLVHLFATWAGELESALDPETVCECGETHQDCICDQRAAESFLTTGDASRLVGLGWPQEVLTDLRRGDTKPEELLTMDMRNFYQKGATPLDRRLQSL